MKNVKKMFLLVTLLIPIVVFGQISSVETGQWMSASTWNGGIVPTASDNVIISAGDTVSVDDRFAVCNSLNFGGENAHIDMNAKSTLSIYGNFTLFSTAHNVFSAGWSSDSAYVVFTGDAAEQVISGFNTVGGSTSFRDLIIDKSNGVVATAGGGSDGMRLGIQNSFEIKSGRFELREGDDIEGRWTSSGYRTNQQIPNIYVAENSEFILMDGAGTHFIRSETGSTPIGKLTVLGTVEFTDASSYDICFDDIDILNGGLLEIGYGMGSTTYGPEFNPDTITVKSGGTLYSITTSDVWFPGSTVILEEGGEYKINSSTQIFPPNFVNGGTVRYIRSNTAQTDQILGDMDYYRLEIAYGDTIDKIWTLGDNRTIADSLEINNSANLVLLANDFKTLTVGNTIRLTSGLLDNSNVFVQLQLLDNAWISRATGTLQNAPIFGETVNLKYSSSVDTVITGPEVPTEETILKDVLITSTCGITLNQTMSVNGIMLLSGGPVWTGENTVILSSTASLNESDSSVVIGHVRSASSIYQNTENNILGIGLAINPLGKNMGFTTVNRTTGATLNLDSNSSISRYFEVTTSETNGLNATITVHYDPTELNDIDENNLAIFISDDMLSWQEVTTTVDVSTHTLTASGLDALHYVTAGKSSNISSAHSNFLPEEFKVFENYPNPFNPQTSIPFVVPYAGEVGLKIYSINGKLVKTQTLTILSGGTGEFHISADTWSSGMYIYKIRFENMIKTGKMLLMK